MAQERKEGEGTQADPAATAAGLGINDIFGEVGGSAISSYESLAAAAGLDQALDVKTMFSDALGAAQSVQSTLAGVSTVMEANALTSALAPSYNSVTAAALDMIGPIPTINDIFGEVGGSAISSYESLAAAAGLDQATAPAGLRSTAYDPEVDLEPPPDANDVSPGGALPLLPPRGVALSASDVLGYIAFYALIGSAAVAITIGMTNPTARNIILGWIGILGFWMTVLIYRRGT